MTFRAVIFDLDGVITDTAEYHYQGWQRLADEEGLPFDRSVNEQLRGVSRRDSLGLILGECDVSEEALQEMMARKNSYYQQMLGQITRDDLLPGVLPLLDQLDRAGIPYALASASRNAPLVLDRLQLSDRFVVIADGNSVQRAKPAPDLFRFAAARLDVPAAACLVIEDAAAGIEAALAAGMAALALGPADRFEQLMAVPRLDSLQGVGLGQLRRVAAPAPGWVVGQEQFDPAALHHQETVFTLGNGYFSSRGSFAESYPGDRPITFAHGIFDDMPISFTQLVNLPNWLYARIRVDGHQFRLDRGQLLDFSQQLDMRRGILQRAVRWRAPQGVVLDLLFERFITLGHDHLGAQRLLVTAVNRPCRVDVYTGINGNVSNKELSSRLDLVHWEHLDQGEGAEAGDSLWLHSRTHYTGIELASALVVQAAAGTQSHPAPCPALPAYEVTRALEPGQTLAVDKLVAYASSRDKVAGSGPQVGAVVERAQAALAGHTYDSLKKSHEAAWQHSWQQSDVVIEGDEEAQLAVRFNLFQLLVAAPRHDDTVSIGAKTLSGYGYRGHVFWDTEIFILPFFSYTQPQIARNMLMYRYHTLPGARRKAAANGYEGAQYAWESAVTGDEVTPRWVPDRDDPTRLIRIWTGDIQIHISADVAYAVLQYWRATGDDSFICNYGAEMVLDTARFWAGRAEPEQGPDGIHYAIRNVIGPDEYHDHVDNNSFTNFMARWHLQTALELFEWLQANCPQKAAELAAQLDLTEEAFAHWRDVAQNLVLLYDRESGLFDQFEGFFELEEVDPELFRTATESLQTILGIEGANRRQVLKQADVLMLLCLFRDRFEQKTWQVNWDAYMPLTDHRYGSSLGPSFHAWAACEIDRPQEAYDHFMLAARADLRNPRGNAGDGIHAASAGGVWQAIVFGFAGLRPNGQSFTLNPCLPAHWQRLAFRVKREGRLYQVEIERKGGEIRQQIKKIALSEIDT